MTVGLVLVSHSAAVAAGLRDLVAQMAPGVAIGVAGGTESGELGTSPDLVMAAIERADTGAGAVLLYDLGSARMSAELALEFLDPERVDRVVIVDASFVEGAVAAGATAAADRPRAEVAAAARNAGRPDAAPTGDPTGGSVHDGPSGAPVQERQLRLDDPAGLHARPAARLVRLLAGLSARVSVSTVDGRRAAATSLIGLLRLAVPAGQLVTVTADGPDAGRALDLAAQALAAEPDAGTGGSATPTAASWLATGTEVRVGAIPAAPGRRVGALARLGSAPVRVPDEPYRGEPAERARLSHTLSRVAGELAGTNGFGTADPADDIAAAHRALLSDPALLDAAGRRIAGGQPVAGAWWDAVGEVAAELAALPDPVIAARAADVTDVGRRVLGELTGHVPTVDELAGTMPAGAVVLADEVPPSLVPKLAERGIVALVLRAGGARSHAAVLARAAGLPLVVGAGTTLDDTVDGIPVLVDGTAGTVQVDPPAETVAALTAAGAGGAAADQGPVLLADGTPLRIAANVGSVADARAAAAAGADGVGLLRTELLFTGRADLPTEDEQVAWLADILAAAPTGPVVLRTVDLGGDKPMPALRLDPVRHGFLGQRGLRLCLARPDLFRTHLRAVLRAGAVRSVELMFPFVTGPDELAAARSALRAAAESLAADGVRYALPERVGMMVEIPTVALAVRPFLPLVDFLSIGSNDLAQYLAAADRTLDGVAAAYRAGEHLVPELVAGLSGPARDADVPVAVCGDLAGDPEQAARLVAAGVTELSVAPPLVAGLRADLAGRLG